MLDELINIRLHSVEDFPGGASLKESSSHCRSCKRLGFHPESHLLILGSEDSLEKARQPTLMFLGGEFHGQRSLVGHGPQGHRELDRTEVMSIHT